jgi:hypothetical protein
MPGSILVPNSGTFENKENTGSQMGHANKKIFLKNKDKKLNQVIMITVMMIAVTMNSGQKQTKFVKSSFTVQCS